MSHCVLNRAVERSEEIMPEVLTRLQKTLFSMYDPEHTDVNIDTTSVAVYAEGTGSYDFGCSRDRRPDLRQVNFGVAELRDPINMPMDPSVDRGNASDSVREDGGRYHRATSATVPCSCSMPEGIRNRCLTS